MKKKTVFLVGDIGSDSRGYFHVGDEAMWVANADRYLSKNWNVIASSRDSNDVYKEVQFISDVLIKDGKRYNKLITQEGISDNTDIHSAIHGSNIVHISGGGNINNLWIGHFYYRCYILHLAHLYRKPVVITSQTVGPLNNAQLKLLGKYTRNVIHFGLRDICKSVNLVEQAGFSKSIVFVGPDDAVNIAHDQNILNKKYVSVSVHDNESKLASIHNIYDRNDEKCIIPHVFDDSSYEGEKFGINICDMVLSQMTKDAKVDYILNMTKQSKLVITTRYHAAVFALMLGIPTIMLYKDDYYKTKFQGLIDYFELDGKKLLHSSEAGLVDTFINDVYNEFSKKLDLEKIQKKTHIYRKRIYETIERYTT